MNSQPQKKNEYLRIRTPRTVDGVNIEYDANRQVIFNETTAPMTAKKHLEAENARYREIGFAQLCHEIEVVQEDVPVHTGKGSKSKDEVIAELKAKLKVAQASEEEEPVKSKKKVVQEEDDL